MTGDPPEPARSGTAETPPETPPEVPPEAPPEPPPEPPTESPPADLQERIRELAYAMWEAGGYQHGRALEYWLEAERRLLASGGGEGSDKR